MHAYDNCSYHINGIGASLYGALQSGMDASGADGRESAESGGEIVTLSAETMPHIVWTATQMRAGERVGRSR